MRRWSKSQRPSGLGRAGIPPSVRTTGTLAYAARIAGVRTRRIAISFSLFNILILVSRTSNSFQRPFLAKRIESNIAGGVSQGLLGDFRWMIGSATLATIVGAALIPKFQGRTSEPNFRRAVVWLVGSRLAAGPSARDLPGAGAIEALCGPPGQRRLIRCWNLRGVAPAADRVSRSCDPR